MEIETWLIHFRQDVEIVDRCCHCEQDMVFLTVAAGGVTVTSDKAATTAVFTFPCFVFLLGDPYPLLDQWIVSVVW